MKYPLSASAHQSWLRIIRPCVTLVPLQSERLRSEIDWGHRRLIPCVRRGRHDGTRAPRHKKQPSASKIYANVIRIEGCWPRYPKSAKTLSHATVARISETRNKTRFGAFKVGMLSPDHVATLRCDADPRSGLP